MMIKINKEDKVLFFINTESKHKMFVNMNSLQIFHTMLQILVMIYALMITIDYLFNFFVDDFCFLSVFFGQFYQDYFQFIT